MPNKTLDYQSPRPAEAATEEATPTSVSTGVWIGAVITVPTLLFSLAFNSSEGGGDFILWIFPVPVLVLVGLGGSLGILLPLLAALVQFPLYGMLLGYCADRTRYHRIFSLLLLPAVHLAAVAACYAIRSVY